MCLTLYQYFLLFILNFKIFSTPIQKRIHRRVIFLLSFRKKSYIEEKQIQCCSWLVLVGEWRSIKSHMFLFFFKIIFQGWAQFLRSVNKN